MADDVHVVVDAGRTPELRAQYEDAAKRGVCPFCEPEYSTKHPDRVVYEVGKYWRLVECIPPREHLRVHVLIIPFQHWERLEEIPEEAMSELMQLAANAETRLALKSASLFMRFGQAAINGAGVEHLHMHIMEGDINDPKPEKVYQKVFDPERIKLLR